MPTRKGIVLFSCPPQPPTPCPPTPNQLVPTESPFHQTALATRRPFSLIKPPDRKKLYIDFPNVGTGAAALRAARPEQGKRELFFSLIFLIFRGPPVATFLWVLKEIISSLASPILSRRRSAITRVLFVPHPDFYNFFRFFLFFPSTAKKSGFPFKTAQKFFRAGAGPPPEWRKPGRSFYSRLHAPDLPETPQRQPAQQSPQPPQQEEPPQDKHTPINISPPRPFPDPPPTTGDDPPWMAPLVFQHHTPHPPKKTQPSTKKPTGFRKKQLLNTSILAK